MQCQPPAVQLTVSYVDAIARRMKNGCASMRQFYLDLHGLNQWHGTHVVGQQLTTLVTNADKEQSERRTRCEDNADVVLTQTWFFFSVEHGTVRTTVVGP